MSRSLNRVMLIGNVGAEPEIRSAGSGRVANLRIATSESWKDKNTGERKEKTEWHSVTVWNEGLVGVIESHVRKGSQVYIEGELRTRKWQDQSGADRYSTEVVISGTSGRLIIVGGNSKDNNNRRQEPAKGGATGHDIDDEMPF